MNMLVRTVSVAALGVVMACATTSPGSHPDDMSSNEHHRTAQAHEQEAAEHQAQYDPKARKTRLRHSPGGGARGEADVGFSEVVYNPTKKHLGHAAEHKEHARQHEGAAKALETYEEAECGLFPKKTRVVCPLLGQVDRVEDIEGGASIYLSEDVPGDAVLAHMRCHYAYGRKMGREGMNGCPMYLQEIRIEQAGEGVVQILSDDPAVVEKIRARAKAHVTP